MPPLIHSPNIRRPSLIHSFTIHTRRSHSTYSTPSARYGQDLPRESGHNLASLLRNMAQLDGLHWIRILYAYPSYFDDDLINEIATNPKVRYGSSTTLSYLGGLRLSYSQRLYDGRPSQCATLVGATPTLVGATPTLVSITPVCAAIRFLMLLPLSALLLSLLLQLHCSSTATHFYY